MLLSLSLAALEQQILWMAGAGVWCLPALYCPVPFPSLFGHKASSALVYPHLSPQDFSGAPWALQNSAVISKGSGSVTHVSEGTTLLVGSQSNVKAAWEHPREGRMPREKQFFC